MGDNMDIINLRIFYKPKKFHSILLRLAPLFWVKHRTITASLLKNSTCYKGPNVKCLKLLLWHGKYAEKWIRLMCITINQCDKHASSFWIITMMHCSSLFSMVFCKALLFSALVYTLLVHKSANLYRTSIRLMFYLIIFTGTPLITFSDGAAHLICTWFISFGVLQHLRATPMRSSYFHIYVFSINWSIPTLKNVYTQLFILSILFRARCAFSLFREHDILCQLLFSPKWIPQYREPLKALFLCLKTSLEDRWGAAAEHWPSCAGGSLRMGGMNRQFA